MKPILKHSHKPKLLMLTSSFPSSPDDETCGYIRDFARALSVEFSVTVLAPRDRSAVEWPPRHAYTAFTLKRCRPVLPLLLDPFQAGRDLNQLASANLLVKLAALISLLCFFAHAFVLALRADAICSHWMVPSGVIGAAISRLLGKPHVVVEHSGAVHLLERMRGGRSIARFVAACSERIVTVSAGLKRKLIKLCPEAAAKAEVVPMGINRPEAICSRPNGQSVIDPSGTVATFTILFVGRLIEIKGLDVLLKAMKGIDGLRLIVAGDGELRNGLESMASDLAINARFIGRVGALEREELLSVCDAVVIPSRVLAGGRTEGMPVVCLEAFSAGRVVIASRAGGLAEAIADGENGLLFEPGDCRMLSEKLKLVLSSDRLRRKIEENARCTAEAYDWSRIGAQFSAIIKSSLEKNDSIGSRRIEAGSVNG
ncbi:MAG: glycosyltransferase family 4 protein [Acidobacteriota bacterium]